MLIKTLFTCVSFVAAAVAQTSRIAFTVLPTQVEAGKPVTLQWGGGDGSAVTITLQQGPSTNLITVQIITGDATGYKYTWTPSKSLSNADNYALKISQGDAEPNYTGMITLTGGSTAASSSALSSATSAASSGVPTNPASGGVIVGGSSGGSSANVTTTQVVMANATATTIIGTGGAVGTGAVGTGVGASGIAATGTAMHRNTTMSKAHLTHSSTAATSSAAATTTGAASTTSSGPAPSKSSKSGAVMVAASNFALLCAAVVGVVYLG